MRTNTPPEVLPDGGTRMTMKRACNGCHQTIGDATDAELDAAIDGRPLPDVTGECPTCSAAP